MKDPYLTAKKVSTHVSIEIPVIYFFFFTFCTVYQVLFSPPGYELFQPCTNLCRDVLILQIKVSIDQPF